MGICRILPRGTVSDEDVFLAPSGLSGEVLSGQAVTLSWTDLSSAETGYLIERNLEEAGWVAVTTVRADATGYIDSELTPGAIYSYRVRAVRDTEQTDPSNTVELIPTPLPGAPPSLSATGRIATTVFNDISLAWSDAATGETSFQIQRSLTGTTAWTTLSSVASGGTAYTDTTVLPDTTYHYRVRAVFAGGYSAYVSNSTASASENGSFRKARGPDASIRSLESTAQGLYFGGGLSVFDSYRSTGLASIDVAGVYRSAFAVGSGFNAFVFGIGYEVATGNVYAAGNFTTYQGASAVGLVRLRPDGSLDPSVGSLLGGPGREVAFDPGGDVYVAGAFLQYAGNSSPGIVRLNSDGSFDAGFAVAAGLVDTVTPGAGVGRAVEVALDGTGDIYVGGTFNEYAGSSRNRLVRINSDGSIDAGFSVGTGFDAAVYSIALATDGSFDVYVGGDYSTYQGVANSRIIRLNSDGSADAGFAIGTGFNALVNSLAVDAAGDIYAAGNFTTFKGLPVPPIVRLNSDGSRDLGFTTSVAGLVSKVALAADGSGDVYIGGDISGVNGLAVNHLVRLNSDGSFDATSLIGRGLDATAHYGEPTYDGTGDFFVMGDFTGYNGTYLSRLARIKADGSAATTFSPPAFNASVTAAAALTDGSGKLYVGGQFTTGGNYLTLLQSNGVADPSFVTTGASAAVSTLAIAPDSSGSVYAGGSFSSFNGSGVGRIAKVTSLGALDASFATGTGFNASVTRVRAARDGSGKIYVAGAFTNFNGTGVDSVVRLNSDGSLDTAFDVPRSLVSEVQDIQPLENGKLYIGGTFLSDAALPASYLARLNNDGTLDTSLVQGTGLDGPTTGIVTHSDGDVSVTGNFSTYQGSAAARFLRLNSDGTLDSTLVTHSGTSGTPIGTFEARDGSGDCYVFGMNVLWDTNVQNLARISRKGSIE